jgi:hypothetical protein
LPLNSAWQEVADDFVGSTNANLNMVEGAQSGIFLKLNLIKKISTVLLRILLGSHFDPRNSVSIRNKEGWARRQADCEFERHPFNYSNTTEIWKTDKKQKHPRQQQNGWLIRFKNQPICLGYIIIPPIG